ncbi:hypothetical protein DIPPA_11751 [Diplonema papillatum]|nr:hypothetical protein DIPPA_11751 [Diplonema papillatum]
MVYTPWKTLRQPLYTYRFWTSHQHSAPWPIIMGTMMMSAVWMLKYTKLSESQRKSIYPEGYPEAHDPILEVDQKYYSMFIRQQGIDITDPVFTGRAKQ